MRTSITLRRSRSASSRSGERRRGRAIRWTCTPRWFNHRSSLTGASAAAFHLMAPPTTLPPTRTSIATPRRVIGRPFSAKSGSVMSPPAESRASRCARSSGRSTAGTGTVSVGRLDLRSVVSYIPNTKFDDLLEGKFEACDGGGRREPWRVYASREPWSGTSTPRSDRSSHECS
jgi:hypothetical protein